MADDTEKLPTVSNEIPYQSKKGDFVDVIGANGPWQRRIFLIMLFVSIPGATLNLAMSFLAPNLDHWCARPQTSLNLSVNEWKTVGLPADDQKCSRYENINLNNLHARHANGSDKIVPCDSWEYDDSFYSSTVLSQWDLVCDRKWLVSLSKSVFMAGILFSNTVFGHLADKLGRRPIIAMSALTAVASATICAFSTSFMMFIATRFFVALGISGCYNTTFVLLMEVIGAEFRSIYGLAINFGWCVGFVSLPGIAWLIRDWFWIQVFLTAPCFILLGSWWMLPESPRWLLSQGKVDEAHKVLRKAATVNGITASDIDITLKKLLTKATEVHESGETKSNVFDLLRTPGLWQITLNIYFVWFVCAFVYYGLSYNTNELAGDPFINFALSGAVEFPAYLLSIFAIRSLGRRNPLAISMVIGGLACLLCYPLPLDPWWLSTTVSMIGKFCITSAFGIIFVYTTELFPTVVRNIGLGSASLCARIGSIIAPFIRELGNATHPVVPQVVFGILALISGGLVVLLPETNNCIVPDTMKEAAEAARRRGKKTKSSKENGYVAVAMSNIEEDTLKDETPYSVPPLSSEKNNQRSDSGIKEGDTKISNAPNGDSKANESVVKLKSPQNESQQVPECIDTAAEINCQAPETFESTEKQRNLR